MRLTIFRHGIAMDREDSIEMKMDDALRPLTEKGREKTRQMAKHLRDHIGPIQILVSSPLVRAQQTAKIISEVLEVEKYMECTELVPDAPPQAFANWLKSHALHVTSVMAVGHEPQLSVFASWILSGNHHSFIDLKKSGALMLEVESFDELEARSAELKWMLSSKLI